jgi:phosphotriesterase-related protein
MKRREFIQIAAFGFAGLPPLAAQQRHPAHVMTVLGLMPATRLGRTLMHEHIMVDFIGADKIAPGRYDPEEVFQKALPYLEKLKAAGGETLVECTPAFIGRDALLLRRLSKASGLNIITSTGFYGAAEDKYVPPVAYEETADELAMRWTREFEDGIPQENVRPGIIKIGVDSGPLSEIDAKLVRAAARAHKRTGLAIASHTGDGVAALAELAVLKEENVDPSAFIWVHAQNESDPGYHQRAAALGAWVEFDGISPESLGRHVELVTGMRRAGYLHRILLSQDAGWFHVGEPGGGEFRGYETLFTEFLPALRKAAITEEEINTLIVRNPRHALALST